MQLLICHEENAKYCSSLLSTGNTPGGHIGSTGSDQRPLYYGGLSVF